VSSLDHRPLDLGAVVAVAKAMYVVLVITRAGGVPPVRAT
jgi:hypothetical protein